MAALELTSMLEVALGIAAAAVYACKLVPTFSALELAAVVRVISTSVVLVVLVSGRSI